MHRNVLFILLVLLLSGCMQEQKPFSDSLTQIIDKFISEHPNRKIINIMALRVDNYDLFQIEGSPLYDSKLIDGCTPYKCKLITYYQTDSLDRYPMVNMRFLKRYQFPIKGFDDINKYEAIEVCSERAVEYYMADKHGVLTKADSFPTNRNHVTGHNVIKNKALNDTLNLVIRYYVGPVYEVRFVKKMNKKYVTLRPMLFYNKEKYDGYFYRNGYLVVLYGTDQTDLLDNTWIRKKKYGIPNYKYRNIKRFLNYPFPWAYEILPNGHLKSLGIVPLFLQYPIW